MKDVGLHFSAQRPRDNQDLDEFGLSEVSLIECLNQFEPYGVWRLDINSGLVYWSRDVFEIHGLPYQKGPVDLHAAIERYHPADREPLAHCVENAILNKVGYRFVLRLMMPDEKVKLVKATAKYRENGIEGPELYGTFSEFQHAIRNVTVGETSIELFKD